MEWPGTGLSAAATVAGLAAVPWRSQWQPDRLQAAVLLYPCHTAAGRCPGGAIRKASRPRPLRQGRVMLCVSLACRDALAFVGSELARDALRFCSNRPGRMPRFCESGPDNNALLAGHCTGGGPSHASIPTAARKCAHKGASCFCGSGLGRDALILVQRPGRLRTQALPQLCCCRCRGEGWDPGRLSAGSASTRTAAARPAPAPHPRAALRYRRRSPHSC